MLGVDHPYEVKSDETPSLLPEGAVAVRFHSIGGWGAITTGKNLGAILGDLNDLLYERDKIVDELGNPKEIIHVSANPKYGPKRKALPPLTFMVAAPERIRVNCDLRHVTVVLCCDPKAFTHTNPLDGMSDGGCLVWESDEEGEQAWERLPLWARKQIIEKKIRVFTLPGFRDRARRRPIVPTFNFACRATLSWARSSQSRRYLREFRITPEQFRKVVHKQYVKKFGRFGDAVVNSNMEVMTQGFERVPRNPRGRARGSRPVDVARSGASACRVVESGDCHSDAAPSLCLPARHERTPVTRVATFNAEFRSGYGYNQPSSACASVGVMAAGTGDTASKYVARRETPLFIPENCTQCMECIAVCPDTALPNCSQDLATILHTAVTRYVTDPGERKKMLRSLPEIEKRTRQMMRDAVAKNTGTPLPQILRQVTNEVDGFSDEAKRQFFAILDKVPMAYQKVNAIFSTPERKKPGGGGIFSIFVSDLCKGCAACVTACGEHEALKMVRGNRRGQCRTRDRNRVPESSAGHAAEISGPVQR